MEQSQPLFKKGLDFCRGLHLYLGITKSKSFVKVTFLFLPNKQLVFVRYLVCKHGTIFS